MNLYQYIHSTLLDAILEKYPEIDLDRVQVHYQVSSVNRTYICTAVPRVIMSTLHNAQNCNTIAHMLISCINPDLTFINPDIFISDGFINFHVSPLYTRTILYAKPVYDIYHLCDILSDKIFFSKIKKLLEYADSFEPEISTFKGNHYPLLNQTETAIITLIAFTEFAGRNNARSFVINGLITLLKKYYLEVPIFVKDVALSHIRIMLLKQVCSALYSQIKNAQST